MTSGMLGVLAGAATSLVIKGIDLLLAYDKGRRGDSLKDRDRLSQDIWKLVAELRNDYDRLDQELQAEREARRKAEEEVSALTHQVSELQEQVRSHGARAEKHKAVADARQSKITSLARVVEKLQTQVAGLQAQDPAQPPLEPLPVDDQQISDKSDREDESNREDSE